MVSELPIGRKAIGFKWALRRKLNAQGEGIRYKARLTVKGCAQKPGIDFTDIFAPVARQAPCRLFLAKSVSLGFGISQSDVTAAFPNAPLSEIIFMKPPPELAVPAGSYLRLNKALYGLKQSSREWNEMISKWFIAHGFVQCISDSCLFTRGSPNDGYYLMVLC